MQSWQLSQTVLSLPHFGQGKLCVSARAFPARSVATSSRTSRANVDSAFSSLSSVLGLDSLEETSKLTQSTSRNSQSRAVAASALPTQSYAPEEEAQIGEVDWDLSLCNNIQILGNLGRDVDYKVLATNRLALFTVAIRNKAREADWVDVEAWGGLAELASQQLGKGMQVTVQGRLKQDKWTGRDGQARSRLKVVASSINKVRSNIGPGMGQSFSSQQYNEPTAQYAQPQQYSQPAASSAPGIDQTYQDPTTNYMDQEFVQPQQYSQAKRFDPNEEKWKVFISDKSRWWDNRQNKRNPKAPDFKHKDTGDGIWLNSAPQWAKDELESPDLGGPAW